MSCSLLLFALMVPAQLHNQIKVKSISSEALSNYKKGPLKKVIAKWKKNHKTYQQMTDGEIYIYIAVFHWSDESS